MTDITEELRVAARSIALAGINGWGNLCEEAADTIDTLRDENKRLDAAQRDQLLAFTKDVMQAWPEGGIDGGELQDIALAHGLLRSAEPPPDWDGCNFYERTELIK